MWGSYSRHHHSGICADRLHSSSSRSAPALPHAPRANPHHAPPQFFRILSFLERLKGHATPAPLFSFVHECLKHLVTLLHPFLNLLLAPERRQRIRSLRFQSHAISSWHPRQLLSKLIECQSRNWPAITLSVNLDSN